MNNDATQAVINYLNAWNETDPARRRVAVAALFTEDCDYTDPLASVRGPSALDQLIAGVQRQLPGFKFSLAGEVDSHHDQARFTWRAAPQAAQESVVVGFDVLLLDAGRIRSVYGFLDKVPG